MILRMLQIPFLSHDDVNPRGVQSNTTSCMCYRNHQCGKLVEHASHSTMTDVQHRSFQSSRMSISRKINSYSTKDASPMLLGLSDKGMHNNYEADGGLELNPHRASYHAENVDIDDGDEDLMMYSQEEDAKAIIDDLIGQLNILPTMVNVERHLKTAGEKALYYYNEDEDDDNSTCTIDSIQVEKERRSKKQLLAVLRQQDQKQPEKKSVNGTNKQKKGRPYPADVVEAITFKNMQQAVKQESE